MSMKLSISTAALERLLGGDTELEIQLRRQVATQFTKDHLVPLLKTEAFEQTISAIRSLIAAEVKEQVGLAKTPTGWSYTSKPVPAEIKDNIKTMVKDMAEQAVCELLDKYVADRIDWYEKRWAGDIARSVQQAFDRDINQLVKDELKKRMDGIIKAAGG